MPIPDFFLPKRLRKASDDEKAAFTKQVRRKSRECKKQLQTMFTARLEREGRLDRFYDRLEWYRLPPALPSNRALYTAMYDFGYKGPLDERRRHFRWVRQGRLDVFNQKRLRSQRDYKSRQRMTTFFKAYDSLPNSAPMSTVIDWVQSHPKMFEALQRLAEDADDEPLAGEDPKKRPRKKLKLSARDIENPSNGPAPSKTAVNKLQAALLTPLEWQNRQQTSDKKVAGKEASDGGGDDDDSPMDDLTEIRRLLGVTDG